MRMVLSEVVVVYIVYAEYGDFVNLLIANQFAHIDQGATFACIL